MSKFDPIRTDYYTAVERAELASGLLFYLGAALSLIALVFDRSAHPKLLDALSIAFALTALGLLIVGLTNRLYWTPRAEDRRQKDFLSSALGVNLLETSTDGYYNPASANPIHRVATQVLENSLFTKSITLRMAQSERLKLLLYVLVWAILVINRQTELGVVLVVSQVVFSEEIFSRWLRLEWLRTRSERTYDELYRLFESAPQASTFNAMTLDSLLFYERSKANASITLSSKVFDAMNPSLSSKWEEIRARLKIE